MLKHIVVMPGQAFELAFTGGPPSNPRTYFDYISSDPAVASPDASDVQMQDKDATRLAIRTSNTKLLGGSHR